MSKFQLEQTTKITLNPDQLMAIVLDTLAEDGHNFEDSEVTSTISKTGIVLSITVVEGKPEPVKRKPRKPRADKGTKVSVKEPEPEAPTPEEDTEAAVVVSTDVFEEASPNASVEEQVAAVKAEAGINPDPDFSAENTDVAPKVNTQEFDFSGLGKSNG